MIIVNYKIIIKESESELREVSKSLSSIKLQERCEILIWLKTGQVETTKQAMELKNRSKAQGQKLWKLYKTEGLSGYLKLKYNPRRSPLEGKPELEARLKSEGFSTIKEAQAWILKTYNITYTENGLGNYFRYRKIKLKTGRPHHPKQKEEERIAYKKI